MYECGYHDVQSLNDGHALERNNGQTSGDINPTCEFRKLGIRSLSQGQTHSQSRLEVGRLDDVM